MLATVGSDSFPKVPSLSSACITEITAVVSTIAGSEVGLANGVATLAKFNNPTGIATHNGNIVVGDRMNHTVRLITPEGDFLFLNFFYVFRRSSLPCWVKAWWPCRSSRLFGSFLRAHLHSFRSQR